MHVGESIFAASRPSYRADHIHGGGNRDAILGLAKVVITFIGCWRVVGCLELHGWEVARSGPARGAGLRKWATAIGFLVNLRKLTAHATRVEQEHVDRPDI